MLAVIHPILYKVRIRTRVMTDWPEWALCPVLVKISVCLARRVVKRYFNTVGTIRVSSFMAEVLCCWTRALNTILSTARHTSSSSPVDSPFRSTST